MNKVSINQSNYIIGKVKPKLVRTIHSNIGESKNFKLEEDDLPLKLAIKKALLKSSHLSVSLYNEM